MPPTVIRGRQVLDGSIQRADLDVSTVGQAVVAKLIQGTNVTLSSTGADAGTGDVTISATGGGAAPPLADTTQDGLLRKVSGLTTDFVDGTNQCQNLATAIQPTISSVRLRSYNSLGNSTMEVDQFSCGTSKAWTAANFIDRWQLFKQSAGTMAGTAQQLDSGNLTLVPGTQFLATSKFFRITLTTAQASLAATDYLQLAQYVEGPRWRELSNDVHSIALLVRSSVVGLKFSIGLRDSPVTKMLTKLCTIPTAGAWTLFTLPSLPVWPAGNFTYAQGSIGYIFNIGLAGGTSQQTPANDTWQTGSWVVGNGIDNFCSKPVNSTFDVALVQHFPGTNTDFLNVPFVQNYEDCLRYLQKTYNYVSLPAALVFAGVRSGIAIGTGTTAWGPFSFQKPMAKGPTLTLYNHATGAAGNVQDAAGTNHASAAAAGISDNGFPYVSFTTGVAATTAVYVHYVADTGW